MYENNTEDTIKQRMLDNIPSDIDKSEGSLIYDAISPLSVELAQGYVELDTVLEKVFAQTSHGEWLEKRASEFGIYRKEGVKATGQVQFEGADGTIIATNSIVQTDDGLQYQTTEEVTISGSSILANIEALAIGTTYNIPSTKINKLPVQITGVTSIDNPNPIDGGADTESDEDLLSRLLLKVQTPSTSGNANHYKLWALEVPGCGDAKVFPIHAGPGTVKVVIIDSEKTPADEQGNTLVSEVVTKIETNRPIGATVTVASATGLNIDISVTITRDTNYDISTVQLNIESKIKEYLKEIAFQQNYVSYGKIGSAILDSVGVIDYTNLTVNSGTANITVADEEVAILGQVIVSE